MNQERAKKFMRDFDEVLGKLKKTNVIEEINKLKEYFINEYPEIFHIEEVNIKLEKVTKHDKRIRDVEETLLTSVSMEPFTNYKGTENDKTLSTLQKVVSKSH